MLFIQWLSRAFRNKISLRGIPTLLQTRTSPRELVGDVKRQLYGMSVQDEAVARKILDKAGDSVMVEQDTFAIDKKNKPHYLRQGQTVRVSEYPLTFNPLGEAHVSIVDERDNILSMRLSDFLHDIQAIP